MQEKPYSSACERNQEVIYSYLNKWLVPNDEVLEVGSGTGQHGFYFAKKMPYIQWHYSDQKKYLKGIELWHQDYTGNNLHIPFELDVNNYDWLSSKKFSAVFSANTLHIMSWTTVENFLTKVKYLLNPQGKLIIYGPFRYQGQYTSDSNAEFDKLLKQQNPNMGIRDFELVNDLLKNNNFKLVHDQKMPANNQLIFWKKRD